MSTPGTLFPNAKVSGKSLPYGVAVSSIFLLGTGLLMLWRGMASRIVASNFLPHSYCYLKNAWLIWINVIADTTIGVAYLAISLTLAYLVYRGRRDLPFHWIVVAFGLFIVACGSTHFIEAVTVWVPVYRLSAMAKALTATISLCTAILLPFSIKPALRIIRQAKESGKHQREREKAEMQFRRLLDAAPDAMAVTNQRGEIVLVNAETERQFGYKREELLGQAIEILMPDRFRERHSQRRGDFITDPRARPMGAELDFYALRKNRTEFPVEISLSPLETDAGLLVTSVIRDITKRKEAELALKQREEHFRLLVDEVTDYAIFSLTPGGNVASWNVGAERMKGYAADEVIGRHFSCFYPAEDVAEGKPSRELKTAINVGRAEDEGWRVRKDGSKFWASVVITAMRDSSGTLKGFSKVSRDITARKHTQDEVEALNLELKHRNVELLAMNKELESFSYSVSHDLRSPLRHIAGFSQLLMEEHCANLTPEAQRYLVRIHDGTSRMGQLIDELLGLARLGRQELKVKVTSLRALVAEVIENLTQEHPRRAIEWRVHDLPFSDCDPALMRQVFTNLLSNAVKFTGTRDTAVIEVGSKNDHRHPVVFVRDNGVGFSMKYAEKLFGVFQRLHRMEDFPGTGVGLATVKRIIQKHGGRIWAEAELDHGATFFFTLASEDGEISARGQAVEAVHGT